MNTRRWAEKLAKESTRWIGTRWGEAFPFYYVSEFPKSGGTWLAQMVGDYLQIPFPRRALLPLGFQCVIQNHWTHDPGFRRVLYLYRDGRDVMTSLYFHHMRVAHHASDPHTERTRRTYQKLFGRGYDPADSVGNLPKFIEFEFARPGRGARVNWRDHVESWIRHEGEGHVTFLSYEELRTDCHAAMRRALERLTGTEVDSARLDSTIEKMSMRNQTGRSPGQTDATQHIRKGIVGDWKNHFSREASEIFHGLAGETLVRLGYEADEGWVTRHRSGD